MKINVSDHLFSFSLGKRSRKVYTGVKLDVSFDFV